MPPAKSRATNKRREPKRKLSAAFPDPPRDAVPSSTAATPAAADETMTTAVLAATTLAKRSSLTPTGTGDEGDEVALEALTLVAVFADTETEGAADTAHFWLAQLLDDITVDELESKGSGVRITWLNRISDAGDGDGEKKQQQQNRFGFAYDDVLEVDSILCHVYALECADGSVEVTPKSMERVERRLARARAVLAHPDAESEANNDGEDSGDDEKPPSSARQRKQLVSTEREDGRAQAKRARTSGARSATGAGRARSSAGAPKKLSKREAALIIPPCYATVDIGLHEDRELRGSHPFVPITGDVLAANKEVIRAVVTQNYELLEQVTESPEAFSLMSAFSTTQSVGVQMTALQHAIRNDDVRAVAQLIKVHKAATTHAFAKAPSSSLPQHSTGAHTSSYSDYNRRAINASRGGREGNNALLADWELSAARSFKEEIKFLWSNPSSSVKMLTLLYPSGDWAGNYGVPHHVAAVARAGNLPLLTKMVEALTRNGGWGFNDLHLRVLSSGDEELPAFRNVSISKKAQTTKLQPLHFAALSGSGKYLKQLWDALDEKPERCRDDGGFELLHYAAVSPSSANLRFLIEKNCSLLEKTKTEKLSPLMCAIRAGRDENAVALLDMAAEKSPELLKQVLIARDATSRQAIHVAVEHGSVRVIERLLHHGVAVDAVAGDKKSALCVAAIASQFEAATTLLASGAKVDLPDKLGKTPLIYAVMNGHTRLAALLINHGANLNAYDSSENSVAHYAASYGWLSCVELLTAAGAELWSRNAWGFVPLICALLKQRPQCSDFMLEHDAVGRFLDFRDREGCTMLFLQCQHSRNLAQITYLVEKGLNPNIPNANGEYALDVLIRRAAAQDEDFFAAAIEVLLRHGALAQYEIVEDKVCPAQPLIVAIRSHLVKVAKLLLSLGKVDSAVEVSYGVDAWMCAVERGSSGEPFLRLLLEHHNEKFGSASPIPFHNSPGGRNVFHVIAEKYVSPSNYISSSSESSEMLDIEILRECVTRCPNVHALMNSTYGMTPLMILLSKERGSFGDLTNRPDQLEVVKRMDKMFSDAVRLFAECTTDPEALMQYSRVNNPKYKSKPAPANADVDTVVEEGEDDAAEAEPEFFTVKVKNILHVVCSRSLFSTPQAMSYQWYGDDILSVVLETFAFSRDEINFAETSGWATPLMLTVRNRNLHGAKLLLERGADPNLSPLRCHDCSTLEHPVSVSACGKHHVLKNTALISAVTNGDVEMAKLLLSFNANLECTSRNDGSTLLHIAVRNKNVRLTKLLLESGADPAATNANGDTPLHIAMRNKDVELTKLLLESGADPAATDANGDTPLLGVIKSNVSIAVKQPHEGEVSYSRSTPGLTVATSNRTSSSTRFESIIEVALANDRVKRSLRIGDRHDRTVVYFAAKNRDLPLLRVLAAAHPDKRSSANCKDVFGRTPLHAAVNAASMNADATFAVERFLLLNGADVNAVDSFRFSALHFALVKIDLDWHATYNARIARQIQEQRRLGTYESIKQAASNRYFSQIPASESDPVETVSNLVAARDVDLLVQDVLDRTPLHLAAATGAFVCASTLLSNLPSKQSQRAALEMKEASGLTPLACAFSRLRQTTITTLIQSNASVSDWLHLDGSSSKARSFFYHAVKHSLAGIYHLLLNAKFSRRQAVEDAILCGEFQLASNLIIGLEISNDSRSLARGNESLGETLVHCIARVDKPFDELPRNITWTLVENGVDLDHVNRKGNSALHFAARTGNAHLMDFLLHHRCDINRRNHADETPLMYALRKEQQHEAKCAGLLDYFLGVRSFDVHAKDRSGRNTLLLVLDLFIDKFRSADSGLFRALEKLLKKGCEPDLVFASEKHHWGDVYGHHSSASSPRAVEETSALMLIAYVAPTVMRYELAELFLKHNTQLTTVDANGNSVLMHLVAKNLKPELELALQEGVVEAVDPRKQKRGVRAAVAQQNALGQTALHIVVRALEYGALENHDVVELLVARGADFAATNHAGESVLECIRSQNSRALFRFVRETYPTVVSVSEHEFFGPGAEDVVMESAPPDFASDADAFLKQCEAAGMMERTPVVPEVNDNCNVGQVSRVLCATDSETGEPIPSEHYNVLLTKVDVKNGRYGLNAFYRMQVVFDELQNIYILFTNWGRIGEEGKYQNTPFRAADDAVVEFKKVFRSKTGNVWDTRRTAFDKKPGKYNLVQRVDVDTDIASEVTEPFNARAKRVDGTEPVAFAPFTHPQPLNLTQVMYAITDVRNLQLAAVDDCSYGGELPLAKKTEIDAAIATLHEILVVLQERSGVDSEIQALAGTISDEATAQLESLSTKLCDLTEVISEKSSRYYEVMPCDENELGSSIKAFDSPEAVNEELVRLKLLSDIAHTYKIILGAKLRQQEIHPLEYCRAALQVNLSPLATTSHEMTLLSTYFFRGIREQEHNRFAVSNIFRVERHGEKERLADLLEREPSLRAKPTHLLWHGTKSTNLMGILAQGLRIAPPEATHHGYAYGKGLYFADVSEKSVGYCGSTYSIVEQSVDPKTGKPVTTRRNVQYLLLCEVALGTPTVAVNGTSESYAADLSIESVKAPGSHAPDMSKSVISPDCDAVVPVGTVGEPGVAYPLDRKWAIEKCDTYSRVNELLDGAAEAFLDTLVAEHTGGDNAIEVEGDAKCHLINRWSTDDTKLTIEVLTRPSGEITRKPGFDVSLRCTLVRTSGIPKTYTFQVRRYRNFLFEAQLDKRFKTARHQNYAPYYNELIVYKEAQARIRYLVEVQSLA